VAVVGPGGDLELASALAGLGLDAAARARSALVTAQILSASDALAFLHPLVGQAIAAELPVHTRAVAHLRAAQLLADRHAEPERIAMHLLGATRSGDAWTVDILRAAARQAGGHGGTESELRYLERALEEPPAPELRPDVLVELGRTEVAAGRAGADARFAAALALTADPARRAEIGQELGRALYVRGSHREAAEAFDAALAELQAAPDAERESELQAGYVAAATIDPDLRADALARADALVGHLARPRNAGERAILAQAALHRTLAGEPRPTVRELAVRAWDDGALLADETAAGFNWTLVTGAFDFTDELELALEVCQAAMADARRLGSPLAFATASYERCIPLYHMGRIAEASADAQAAVDATRYGWEMYARSAAYTLSLCQIERDDLEAAERTLEILDREPAGSSIEHPALLDARAILRRRQGRHEESLAAHLEAGRLFTEVFGVMTTGDVAWRLGAAEAALALGDAQRAGSLAEEELEFSQRVGLTRGIVGALRVLGLAQGGRAGLQSLERAVNHPEPAPSRLEHLRALIDFGSALRRANQRADAREVLEAAVRRTGERGATALATRARRELEATGARSRSNLRHGMDAVTPSELRVAELAAQGHTNREIALALFVTTKTVEYHLRQVFQKLDISSRRELPEALGQRVAA
jgi:DNA-binding CsgD family transcriptional regulator